MGDRMRSLSKLSDDALLDRLAALASELEQVTSRQKVLWGDRLVLYREARTRVPPITHRRLAAAAGVSEVAIISKLRQLAERSGNSAA